MASVVDRPGGLRRPSEREPRGGLGTARAGRLPPRVAWAVHHLLSFEAVFVLFLYSNEIKMFLGWVPGDETVTFAALSILIGGWVVLREGVYVRGLATLAAGTIFVAYAVASWGWSPSRELAVRTATYLVTFNLWCVAAGALIVANNRERTTRFLLFVAAIGLALSVMGIAIYAQHGTFRNWEGWDLVETGRVYLAFGYTAADAAAVLLCVTLFSKIGTGKQLVAGVLFATVAFFLLIAGGRAPFGGMALACVLALLLNPPRVGRGRFELPAAQILALAIFAAAAAYVAYLVTSGEATNTLDRFYKAFNEFSDPSAVSGPSRVHYWPAAIRYWIDSPWFGNGLASFSVLFRGGMEVAGTHPHNIVLEILAEQGLVGLVLFSVFAWSALRHVKLRRLKVDPLLLAVVMITAAAFMQVMFAKELAGGRKFFFMLALLTLRPPTPAGDEAEGEDAAGETRGAWARSPEHRRARHRPAAGPAARSADSPAPARPTAPRRRPGARPGERPV